MNVSNEIPKLDIKIQSITIKVQPRKLKDPWKVIILKDRTHIIYRQRNWIEKTRYHLERLGYKLIGKLEWKY